MTRWLRQPRGTKSKLTEPARQDWLIERFNRSLHDRHSFDCGKQSLDDWIKRRVSQYEKHDLARTYVAVRRGSPLVLGYYALSSHRVTFDCLLQDQAKGVPRIDVPVVLLGRLAVDTRFQGQGLGELLLLDALRRSEYVATQLGVRAVEVLAIDEVACRFYLKYGFLRLVDDPHHLFLPMRVIRQLGLGELSSKEGKE